ncbi:MAG: excinuclease ABC subunit UvrC [Actinomycetota bacterium]
MVPRPPPGSVPDAPGSYQFLDAAGRVIYVGKAKSLRSRVGSYFAAPGTLAERTRQMVDAAATVEWIVARNEVEALLLEFNLIKVHRPRFNVRLKDDKSFPFLAVTVGDPWPRATFMRGRKRTGVRYFGPYTNVSAIRETLDLLLRTFPVRTCSDAKLERHRRLGRPCLFAHIEKCAAPCVDAVTPEEYSGLVGDLLGFLAGDHDPVLRRLEAEMSTASDALEFERAARLRDQLANVRRAVERQQMVAAKEEDFDLLGLAEDPLEAAFELIVVRRGRVAGRRTVLVDRVEDLTVPALIARVVEQLYAGQEGAEMPRELLVPVEPDDVGVLEEALTTARGTRVRIRVPQRGGKRELLETANLNARESFRRHRLRRASDHNARARALVALREALDLPEAPLRIECYDISNLQGTEIVGSMVVLEDGLPKPTDYRHFRVRLDHQDDFAAMEDVLTRRLRRLVEDERTVPSGEAGAGSDPGSGATATARRRFAYPPNLLLIDGGRGQLNVAVRVLERLGVTGVAVAGLAKRFEEVYLPDRPEPVRIPRDSEALYLLQQARDEAHRFAVSHHRRLRGKRMTRSVLDGIPGLGPARRKRLLAEFGTVRRLRELSEEELVGLPWLPDGVARSTFAQLHAPKRARIGER